MQYQAPIEKISSLNFPIRSSWFMTVFVFNALLSVVFALWITAGITSFLFVKMRYIPWGWSVLCAVLAYSAVFIFLNVWNVLWKRRFYFECTSVGLLTRSGVLTVQEKLVPYSAIQNVILKYSYLGNVYGFCTVIIENAASKQGKEYLSTRVILPGQFLERGPVLVDKLNQILSKQRG